MLFIIIIFFVNTIDHTNMSVFVGLVSFCKLTGLDPLTKTKKASRSAWQDQSQEKKNENSLEFKKTTSYHPTKINPKSRNISDLSSTQQQPDLRSQFPTMALSSESN